MREQSGPLTFKPRANCLWSHYAITIWYNQKPLSGSLHLGIWVIYNETCDEWSACYTEQCLCGLIQAFHACACGSCSHREERKQFIIPVDSLRKRNYRQLKLPIHALRYTVHSTNAVLERPVFQLSDFSYEEKKQKF